MKQKKRAIEYNGKKKTFIKVFLLPKARKGNYKEDIIHLEIKSKTHHIAGDMTEGEALIIANGLINAICIKAHKEKRI